MFAQLQASPRSRTAALLLCLLGALVIPSGLHRFYVGKWGTGLLWLCTGGLLGVGTIIDMVLIASGDFRDIQGRPLVTW